MTHDTTVLCNAFDKIVIRVTCTKCGGTLLFSINDAYTGHQCMCEKCRIPISVDMIPNFREIFENVLDTLKEREEARKANAH